VKHVDFVQGTLDLLNLKTISLERKRGWAVAKHIQQVSRDALQIQQTASTPTALSRRIATRVQWVAGFALAFASIAVAEQPATSSVFDPLVDCDKMPALIRDAAKDAGIANGILCYISDRSRFALKAGEAFARDLADMVRVVVPFAHLLLVNGTEPAVQMAVRFYDSENRKRAIATGFLADQEQGIAFEVVRYAAETTRMLRMSYASLLMPYGHRERLRTGEARQ
jgi:hypothetical protein